MSRRSNFALDADTVAMLHKLQDRHEAQHGFRPAMVQIVSGLIRTEVERKATP